MTKKTLWVAACLVGAATFLSSQAQAASDCVLGVNGKTAEVWCNTVDHTVSGTAAVLISCDQLGGLIFVTGGGTVPLVLPDAPCRGRDSGVNIVTDGATAFSLTTQTPSKTQMLGVPSSSSYWKSSTILLLPAGGTAWAVYRGNNAYAVGIGVSP